MLNTLITEEALAELKADFLADGGLHGPLKFYEWKKRHGYRGIEIKDVSYLLRDIYDERNESWENIKVY